jgi:peptide/nickel transport system permease protein
MIMTKYILKRIFILFPMLLGMTFITFMVMQMAPGDFLDSMRANPQISPETVEEYAAKYHLDKSALAQYGYWLKSLFTFDLGYSFAYKAKVSSVIGSRAWNTLVLSLASIVLTWFVVIPVGVICALKKRSLIDRALSFFSYLGLSLPGFFLALVLLYGVSHTGLLPLGGMKSVHYFEMNRPDRFFDLVRHLILPTLVLSLGSIASLQRIMRANMLEVLNKPYILAARARGLSTGRVLFVHALRNAVNPMVTIFGYQFSALLSGAALIEIVFGWPGLGTVMLEAVQAQDLYLVMGGVLISGVLLITGNLLADLLLAAVDPRIRYD